MVVYDHIASGSRPNENTRHTLIAPMKVVIVLKMINLCFSLFNFYRSRRVLSSKIWILAVCFPFVHSVLLLFSCFLKGRQARFVNWYVLNDFSLPRPSNLDIPFLNCVISSSRLLIAVLSTVICSNLSCNSSSCRVTASIRQEWQFWHEGMYLCGVIHQISLGNVCLCS